jgi:hypothetical protein
MRVGRKASLVSMTKRDVYSALIKPWKDLLFSSIQQRGQENAPSVTPEMVRQATEAAFDAIFYASDEVLKQYGAFRTMGSGTTLDPNTVLIRVAALLKSMRKDLGYTFTAVDELDILTMFVNIDAEQRLAFKKALNRK